MKKLILPLIILLMSYSCGRQKAITQSAVELNSVPARAESMEGTPAPEPLVEKTEKIVEVEKEEIAEMKYFVITGSFRQRTNAMTFQEQIGMKGFHSSLLKNDEGLFRVSVMATDNIESARNEIYRIRKKYPEYADTWLLISEK